MYRLLRCQYRIPDHLKGPAIGIKLSVLISESVLVCLGSVLDFRCDMKCEKLVVKLVCGCWVDIPILVWRCCMYIRFWDVETSFIINSMKHERKCTTDYLKLTLTRNVIFIFRYVGTYFLCIWNIETEI